MSASVVSNTCRITVISATLRADLAVPVHIPVAELLATLVSSLGTQVADEGAGNGGWVLQRAAEPPLDPALTLAASQIRDGDVLHLRTRSTQLPEIAFDDVLDAVATGVLTRTVRWQPAHTLVAAVGFALTAAALGLLALLAAGPDWVPAAVTAGVSAVLLLVGAAVLGRTYRRRGAALVAAGCAVTFASVAGALAVGADHDLLDFGAPQLLLGASAAVLAAVVSVLVLGAGLPGLVAVIGAGLLTAAGAAAASVTSLQPTETASLVAAVALALSPVLPVLAFRLSRLPLPSIPTDAADLRRETGRIDSTQILRQATLADQFLTGLVAAVAVSLAGAAAILATGGGSARALALVLGVLCLLRARLFTGRSQRAVLLVAGGMALAAVCLERAFSVTGTGRVLAVAVPALVSALVLFAVAAVVPGRRWAPTWSRTADVVEAMLVLSVIPLALGVMGVYGSIRSAVS